jgi:XTP/dITP diphosphohydrolase
MNKLLIATTNAGKIHELHSLLGDLKSVELVNPADLGLDLHVKEDGADYKANAALKAHAFAAASGLPALADDSGLEVDALGGAPGLYSARYSPKTNATDADRRAYLLSQLAGKPQPWPARFVSAICIALPDGTAYFAEGTCTGQIVPQERGSGGFGYDAIFEVENQQRTMAELSMAEKNQLSHRARAILAAKEILRDQLGWE